MPLRDNTHCMLGTELPAEETPGKSRPPTEEPEELPVCPETPWQTQYFLEAEPGSHMTRKKCSSSQPLQPLDRCALKGKGCLHFCDEKFHNFLSYFCSFLGCFPVLWWCGVRAQTSHCLGKYSRTQGQWKLCKLKT